MAKAHDRAGEPVKLASRLALSFLAVAVVSAFLAYRWWNVPAPKSIALQRMPTYGDAIRLQGVEAGVFVEFPDAQIGVNSQIYGNVIAIGPPHYPNSDWDLWEVACAPRDRNLDPLPPCVVTYTNVQGDTVSQSVDAPAGIVEFLTNQQGVSISSTSGVLVTVKRAP